VFLNLDLALWHESIHAVGPGISTLLNSLQIFFLAAIGLLFFGERPGGWQMASLVLAVIGVALIASPEFAQNDRAAWGLLSGVVSGAMLALSGAVFQSLSRNPLGSPDIVGFTTGASSGGLFMLLLAASASDLQVSVGAVLGGFATAAVVALVSRRGGVGGDNLILTGVAISEMLSAANSYLISQASLPSAETAKAWQYGSFNAISWGQVKPLALAAAVLLIQVVWLVRPASLLEMGDDAATSLGLRVGRVRGAMLGYGVVLAAGPLPRRAGDVQDGVAELPEGVEHAHRADARGGGRPPVQGERSVVDDRSHM